MSRLANPLADFDTCKVCGEIITGSHYHCACGTADVTSMLGHYVGLCRVTGKLHEQNHHCGPNGDCELTAARDEAVGRG